MLLLHNLEPWHWAAAGAAIGGITLLLQFLSNTNLGISTGLENLCAVALRAPYFRREALRTSASWRLPFLAGLVSAGALSALAGGGWSPFWDMGIFDSRIGWGPAGKIVWMFAGGALIGFGTRSGGGCTSGHGIYGLSTFQPASIVAVLSFMAAGVVTTNLVYRVIAAG
jgi:uncharacterized membrane protein YedE/YeeE